MKIELQVQDRLLLLSLLHQCKGGIILIRMIKQTLEDLDFDKEERELLGIQYDSATGNTQWNADVDKPREFEIEDEVARYVKKTLKKQEDQNSLGVETLGLWETFVGE